MGDSESHIHTQTIKVEVERRDKFHKITEEREKKTSIDRWSYANVIIRLPTHRSTHTVINRNKLY